MKNTIKKLLSVILSAVTVFSLLTLPAHAIIPGEDAYPEESTIVRYNFESGTTTPVEVPDFYSMNPGISTHDFLSESEIAQANNAIMPNEIIGDDNRITVNPTNAPYSGIVLIVRIVDIDGDGDADTIYDGTGFMVSSKIMISAMHVFDDYDTTRPNATAIETRIYQGVVSLAPFYGENPYDYLDAYLSEYSFKRVSNITYDTRYIAETRAGNYNIAYNYDWCVATLQSGITGYYFDCQVPTMSINDMQLAVTGYPTDYSYLMKKATGYIYMFEVYGMPYLFKHTIDTMDGQSGAPVYNNATNICYGIHVSGDWSGAPANCARTITSDLLNILLNEIANS